MSSQVTTGHRLDLGDPATAAVSVDFAPQASLIQMLLSAAAPTPSGPATLAVRRSLSPAATFAVSCLGDPRVRQVPDILMPLRPGSGASVGEQVDALRSTPGEVLAKECFDTWGARIPAVWRPGVDEPDRWLESFAQACVRAWATYLPRWREGYPLLRREARRIGLAAVTGQLGVLLDDLHPRIRFEGHELRFTAACDGSSKLGSRRLVLVPMLIPSRAVTIGLEDPSSVYVAYAISRRSPDGRADDADTLSLLVGPVRAALLRAVRRPQTVSSLAGRLNCAPSTVTYHCDQLVAAGLVVRERRGPATWIYLTQRAVELQELTATYPEWA